MNKDEIFQTLQGFLRTYPTIIAGTGLSISMGIPGMDGLLGFLEGRMSKSFTTTSDVQKEWNKAFKLIKQFGFEEGLGKISISDELLEIIVKETAKFLQEEDTRFFKKYISDATHRFPFADLINHLAKSLSPNNPELNIITPNYDQIVEYACDRVNVKCWTGFEGTIIGKFKQETFEESLFKPLFVTEKNRLHREFIPEPRVKLFKPHGSIWWQRCNDQTYQFVGEIPNSKIIIITPGLTKYKSSLLDAVMNYHREAGNKVLRKANSVIVIGYGFNDDHLHNTLIARISEGIPCLVLTRSLSAKAKGIVSKYPQIFAIESNDSTGAKWYYNKQEGVLNEPLWDLNSFVSLIIKGDL
jgi:hypothetical protein